MTLKSRSEVTQGHWKWHHSIDCIWFPISVSIETLSLRSPIIEIFNFKHTVTLKTGLGGPSGSLEMSPCDRAHKTSYWRSIVTVALLCRFWDNWMALWKNLISSTSTEPNNSIYSAASLALRLIFVRHKHPQIYASGMTISGERIEQQVVIGFGELDAVD